MNSIIKSIFRNVPLTEDESNFLYRKLVKKNFKKGEYVLKADEEINHLYYVVMGCLRTYFVDAAGKEHTLQFAIRGWWISDYITLFGNEGTKSVSYIECIKDSEIYAISKNDFDKLCIGMPKVGHFHIKNLETAFSSFQKRILERLTLSAKERYVKFIQTYPDIEQSVKNYHIASYLGITTESLSRIRKELALN